MNVAAAELPGDAAERREHFTPLVADRKSHPLGQNADHGPRNAVENDHPADYVRIEVKPRSPRTVSQNDDGRSPELIVGRREEAAGDRPDAEDVKKRRGNVQSENLLRRPAAGQIERFAVLSGDILEGADRTSPVEEVGIRHGERFRLARAFRRQHDRIGILVRKRRQHRGVYHAEHDDIGRDP